MSVVSLMNCLCERGLDVTVITNERSNTTDFRYDYRIKRLSFDMGVKNCFTRAEKLAHFLEDKDGALVVATSCLGGAFSSDAVVIRRTCRLICFQPEGFLCSETALPSAYTKDFTLALMSADAIVTGSAADYLVLKNDGFVQSAFVPFFHPFFEGDFRLTAADKSNTLLVTIDENNASLCLCFLPLLVDFAKRNSLIIKMVFGSENAKISAEIAALPQKLGYGDTVIAAPNGQSLADCLCDCRMAAILRECPSASYSYANITARGIPTVFLSEIQDATFSSVSRGDEALAEKILKCALSGNPTHVISDEAHNKSIKKWIALFSAVAGETEIYDFAAPPVDDYAAKNIIIFSESRRLLPAKDTQIKCASRLAKYLTYKEQKHYEKYSCVQISDEEVRKSQLLALKMLKELERICKKHGISYYIAAGSLLGAARHGGQIPWDDDVDVTMPRPDYEKFIKIAQTELPPDMIMPANNYPYGFHRIQIKGTSIERALRQKGPHGIFLDILPLDGAAPTDDLKKKHAKINERLIFLMYETVKPQPVFTQSSYHRSVYIKRLALKLLVPKRLLGYLWKRNATKYSTDSAREWVCLAGYYGYKKECFPKEFWGEAKMLMYDGRECPVMFEWKKYLELHYGDYMQCPPRLFRRTHFFYSVNFGKYRNMSVEEIEGEIYNAQ